MRLAGEAEVALEERRPAGLVEDVLRRLALALTTLREEAAVVLEGEPQLKAETVTRYIHKNRLKVFIILIK